MSSIIFLKTGMYQQTLEFYKKRLGFQEWLSQPEIEIISRDGLLLGFQRNLSTTGMDIVLTIFVKTKDEVELMYRELIEFALDKPKKNEKYKIYNFYLNDPEGRTVEIQMFEHETRKLDVDKNFFN